LRWLQAMANHEVCIVGPRKMWSEPVWQLARGATNTVVLVASGRQQNSAQSCGSLTGNLSEWRCRSLILRYWGKRNETSLYSNWNRAFLRVGLVPNTSQTQNTKAQGLTYWWVILRPLTVLYTAFETWWHTRRNQISSLAEADESI